MKNQILNIEEWNEHEIRIEISGNGHYIRKEDLTKFIRKNALILALEIKSHCKK